MSLAALAHAQLLEIAAAGCEASPDVKNSAEAVLAETNPPGAELASTAVLPSAGQVDSEGLKSPLDAGRGQRICRFRVLRLEC